MSLAASSPSSLAPSELFDGSWTPAHRRLASAMPLLLEPQELFDVFASVGEGAPRLRGDVTDGAAGPGVVYFNYELEPNVFSRQRGEPTAPEHVPAAGDGSFAGYTERIKRLLGGARYCLRLTELHAYAPAIFKRLAALVAPLGTVLSADARCVRTTVFVGDYDYTPFGVHVDPYPQIQCVVTGTRTALFWDSSYWADRTAEERLAPWNHIDAAHQVQMGKDEAVYWAADYEHAFSSRGGFAIALTISFPPIPPPPDDVEAARRRSAHQLLNVPAARPPCPWHPDRLFRGDQLFRLEVFARGGAETVVGAGSAFTIEGASLAPVVARINDGAPFRAADLGLDEDDARALLEMFHAHHCVEVVPRAVRRR